MRWGDRAAVAGCGLAGALAALGALGVPARADDWLPHPADAKWQYRWSDTTYNPSGTTENVIVQQQKGTSFTLAWADTSSKPPAAGSGPSCTSGADAGTMTFQDTNAGLVNTDWNSCPPPSDEPILCASTTQCANSLSSALYNVIWGNRAPVVSEPLLQGTSWNAAGGAQNDVSSTSTYLGLQLVKVPAFPAGVLAAAVRTNIVQAGAIGDPYGSGIRTTWWVYGVGPVRVVFQHAGGSSAPVTEVSLLSTSLKPLPRRPDEDVFPLRMGLRGTYSWTNNRYMRQPEIERLSVDAVANRSARISFKSVSGPMRAAGQYGFTTRIDGVTNIFGSSAAASVVKFPSLGHGRHFFTPFDLMTFGFNPMLAAYPITGTSWRSGNPADFRIYGVTGQTTALGFQSVKVPAGRFDAFVLRSTLRQAGHRFGSGVRTMWFAPDRGLVKLVFRHADGSVSTVQLVK